MASSSSSEKDTLEYTPTWVVAVVCSVIIAISLVAERLLHHLGKFLKRKKQDSLFSALQKLKEELMILGFISLLLTVSQSLVSHICIPRRVTSYMLPCKEEEPMEVTHYGNELINRPMGNRRRLMSGGDVSNICISEGKVPLLSLEALHQLHIFIFVLAVVHVVFCATTMVLGGAKIRQWKHWEAAIRGEHLEQTNLPTSEHHPQRHPHHDFIMERAKGYWRRSFVGRWIMSFFKQFYLSVTKSDYTALRAGFIMRHCRRHTNFDFHEYMMRALEDDFKRVVGISWYLWLFVIIFMLLNVQGWHTYFWLSFLPLILLLAVGAKLEHIITRLAEEIKIEAHGAGVKPSNRLFWFHRPGIVLYLIHFLLFQNAFEMAFFFWILSTYGIHSCIMESMGYLIPRLVIGLIIQLLCSYSTLPLYAIVTQMGDSYKRAIFAEHMQTTLHGWVDDVRKRKRSGAGLSSVFRMFRHKSSKHSLSSDVHMLEAGGSSRNTSQRDGWEVTVSSP
ncbi:MLO-like protein 13 [Iris pallida]|uniref:MLO-like protein n=1 Tax=Iris pallida TaxID=29817 RepID=A0AAX6FUV3_IRIPA|nr:MLO-like protein 13 [Iris pallida]